MQPNHDHFPFLLLLVNSGLFIFILTIPYATSSLTFNFPSFNQTTDHLLKTEGQAIIGDQYINLTGGRGNTPSWGWNAGRVIYHEPFLLRDPDTFKLAHFTTRFKFLIDARGFGAYSHGLAFFLAPFNSSFYNSSIGGSSLGLPVDLILPDRNQLKSEYPFVAVEFDIYNNSEPYIQDPIEDHVGLNDNSIHSIYTSQWDGDILNARENEVTITFNSTTDILSVDFTTMTSIVGKQTITGFKHYVDLKGNFPETVAVGFSAATDGTFALHRITSWSFASSMDDQWTGSPPVDSVVPPPPSPSPDITVLVSSPSPSHPRRRSGSNIGLAVALSSIGGCIVLVCASGFVWFFLRKRKGRCESGEEDPRENASIDQEFEKRAGPRKFLYTDLTCATSDFAEKEKLGEGGFGGVYKGFLKDLNLYVAVKRISKGSKQGRKEYAAEVNIISQLRHRNLVQLIGWCHEKKELLLVYEFMPHGSLDCHLFKAKSLLTWEARYKIAQGLASALLYLHEEWEQCVLHRDIKASNVMLDSNFNAKLGDFGLARLMDHEKQSTTTMLAGTMGYMALEYVTSGKARKESDVYSFGVVALEIACGRKSIDTKFQSCEINLVERVWELYEEGKVLGAADPKLCGDYDEKQMECLLTVGLWCAHINYTIRPSMQQAMQVLKFEAPLPILPSNTLMGMHSAPLASLPTHSCDSTHRSRLGKLSPQYMIAIPGPHSSPHELLHQDLLQNHPFCTN